MLSRTSTELGRRKVGRRMRMRMMAIVMMQSWERTVCDPSLSLSHISSYPLTVVDYSFIHPYVMPHFC